MQVTTPRLHLKACMGTACFVRKAQVLTHSETLDDLLRIAVKLYVDASGSLIIETASHSNADQVFHKVSQFKPKFSFVNYFLDNSCTGIGDHKNNQNINTVNDYKSDHYQAKSTKHIDWSLINKWK